MKPGLGRRGRLWLTWLLLSCGVVAVVDLARAQDTETAQENPPLAEPEEPDARVANVAALIAGTLDVSVDPQTLFDVSLSDETAIEIESVRVRALLATVTESEQPVPTRRGRAPVELTAVEKAREAIGAADPARWQQRLALDRARFAFYVLAPERRAAVLKRHEQRQAEAHARETDAERTAREAEEERRRAFELAEAERARVLEEARLARSEAERVVAEELARLIGLEQTVVALRDAFRARRQDLVERRDRVLGWQRRAREVKNGSADEVDAAYAELRTVLRASRNELDRALEAAVSEGSEVPELGDDPLGQVVVDVPSDAAVERRKRVAALIYNARKEERALRNERASGLLAEIDQLNAERLGLLRYLSSQKRSAITGFTEVGLDQARSELRHLTLILREHRRLVEGIVGGWTATLRDRDGVRGTVLAQAAAATAPWLLLFVAFAWWRRRSAGVIAQVGERLWEIDRAERRALPSPSRRLWQFLQGVHRPLEWLALFGAAVWVLPAGPQALLEVQLLIVVIGWALAGALVVNTINALAIVTAASRMDLTGDAGPLRLRSLRLVGRVTVLLVLVLVVSARLVGRGTIYQWVMSTCWFAALPVFLVLVKWWRATVFQRVERERRKSRLQLWLLDNRAGWKSFFAAMVGAVHLFVTGTLRVLRRWVGSFDITRHAHAYLFKRGLDRLEDAEAQRRSLPPSVGTLDSLTPDRASETWVTCPADDDVETIRKRLSEGRGGVIAIVGVRGLGKSSLLRRLMELEERTFLFGCNDDPGVGGIESALRAWSAAQGATSPQLPRLALLDDAQALVKPVLNGIRPFDEVLAFARAQSDKTLWVFAIDGLVWPFLRRARDARPLFDEVVSLDRWTDDQIGALLTSRSQEAKVTPTFEDLLEPLPATADEIDKQDALTAKRVGYFRMIWDYAGGNPAIALEVWRNSLQRAPGSSARVRPLRAPRDTALESLPDQALFILRAVLQISPATIANVSQATRFSEAHVRNAVGYGLAQGYLVMNGEEIRVTWAWLRAVTLFLERRHLVVNS